MDRLQKLFEIRPRSVVYLFSGGKDSALALLKTRDVVKRYAEEAKARVYIVHITIPGNTHPLNVFAAAAVAYWHQKHYGFEPKFLCRDKVFQELMARAGLSVGPQRWCFIEFKYKVMRELDRTLPRPLLHIDGMKRTDSRIRKEKLKDELELVETSEGTRYWAWHPLFDYDGDPLEELRQYPEFRPIVWLYEKYGDSLNCMVCPYYIRSKKVRHLVEDGVEPILSFVDEVMYSDEWKRKIRRINIQPLTNFMKSPW